MTKKDKVEIIGIVTSTLSRHLQDRHLLTVEEATKEAGIWAGKLEMMWVNTNTIEDIIKKGRKQNGKMSTM